MTSKALHQLVPEAKATIHGQIPISGISSDSRTIKSGDVFFALPGFHVQGDTFANQAYQNGAVAIVSETNLTMLIPVILVENARKALSYAAAEWYEHPGNSIKILGVTGTDGKSSTVYYTQQLLTLAGEKAGFFSTVAYVADGDLKPNDYRQSTLEALDLQNFLRQMVNNGMDWAIIEATSHGLSHRTARLLHVPFRAGAFTNLSHEHLEFHGSFEQYRSDKTNLFRELKNLPGGPVPFCVLNAKDPSSTYIAGETSHPIVWYFHQGAKELPPMVQGPQLVASDTLTHGGGMTFTLTWETKTVEAHVQLVGAFNVDNICAALLLAAGALRVSPLELVQFLPKIQAVKGRMRVVDEGQDYTVVVDYAHTPGSFETILPLMKQSCKGRLMVVFGSGGERDTAKRPIQGALAASYADIVILTNEDPRLEDEHKILQDIALGVQGVEKKVELHLIPYRPSAVELACRLAQKDDTILLLGKGHEQSIVYPQGKVPYDEETCAREAIQKIKAERHLS